MWTRRYFPGRYFARRYWPGGVTVPVPPDTGVSAHTPPRRPQEIIPDVRLRVDLELAPVEFSARLLVSIGETQFKMDALLEPWLDAHGVQHPADVQAKALLTFSEMDILGQLKALDAKTRKTRGDS